MKSAWFNIPDIYWHGQVSTQSRRRVYTVEVGLLSALIIEDNLFWLLLINLPMPAEEAELSWLKYANMMLAANKIHQYGILQRDGEWWLARRYSVSWQIDSLKHFVAEHTMLTNFLGKHLQKEVLSALQQKTERRFDDTLTRLTKNGWV